jgi:hypothetical protein
MVAPGWNVQTSTGDEEVGGPGGLGGLLGPNEPVMNNMLAESFSPAQTATTAVVMLTATVTLAKLFLPSPGYISNLNVFSVAGAGITQLVGGIYSMAGNLVATSANSVSGLAANTIQPMPLTVKSTIPSGFVYAAVATVGATTTFSALTYSAGLPNVGLLTPAAVTTAGLPINGATAPLFMTGGTGFATTLPATLVPAQFAATTQGIWVGLN